MKFRILIPKLLRTRGRRISEPGAVLGGNSLSHRELLFENFAQDVTGEDVRLLDARCVCRRNFKQKIRGRGDSASAFAREGHGDGSDFARGLEGEKDIAAVPRGGDSHYDVALARQRFDLALEDVLVTVVVAGGSEDRGVSRESDRRDAGSIEPETDDQLAIEMLRVCGAAAVAAPQDFAAHPDGEHHLGGDLIKDELLVVEGLDDLDVLGKCRLEDFGSVRGGFGHGGSSSWRGWAMAGPRLCGGRSSIVLQRAVV